MSRSRQVKGFGYRRMMPHHRGEISMPLKEWQVIESTFIASGGRKKRDADGAMAVYCDDGRRVLEYYDQDGTAPQAEPGEPTQAELDSHAQRQKVSHALKKLRTKTGQPWSDTDDDLLLIEFKNGISFFDMARNLERNVEEVVDRLVDRNLIDESCRQGPR